ncbi:hypothetical protein JZ751_006199 [Albula glossodonta]|uniref:Pyridoxal-dependent decarboxylase domain-containing protein 1 n=1 Tax=Albula glossodonta TaxID=121402 RepID=A0A8T2N4Y6_9TELE|nr:hypothetical protein JZ751_006199 [Albula glossodonta]
MALVKSRAATSSNVKYVNAASVEYGPAFQEMIVDPMLAEMGKNLNEAMKILEDGQREVEEKRRGRRRDIPGPLQGGGQDVASILQLVQNLMHGDEEEDNQSHRRMQNVGEQGNMALLGHSLAAYISVLDRERLRKLTTRILSDTTLWLCRLFRLALAPLSDSGESSGWCKRHPLAHQVSVSARRALLMPNMRSQFQPSGSSARAGSPPLTWYENGSAYYHEDDREGLIKVCRLVIHSRYEDYTTEGFTVLSSKQPVVYQSAAARPGLGQHLCSQLGLPLSSLCTVPCNTMFGSQHQMDVALLDRLIRDDIDSGKLPLLLIANAGTQGAGHTDKLARLKELVNLATLALGYVTATSSVMAATKCDSMTLTLGPWLGLPAVPAVTLYRHEDPALVISLAAGLTSSQPVEKLRALPLWLSLQYLGHDGIVERIKHASQLVRNFPYFFM